MANYIHQGSHYGQGTLTEFVRPGLYQAIKEVIWGFQLCAKNNPKPEVTKSFRRLVL
jgi:hypothetical protein